MEAAGGKVWRLRIYAMENDPERLLARLAGDLPEAVRLKEKRVE
jgi:hypothetical protein